MRMRAHVVARGHHCEGYGYSGEESSSNLLRTWRCYVLSLSYCHTHCPCEDCNGRGVSWATEYRHWKKASEAFLDLSVNHDIEQSDMIHGDGNGDTEEHSTN